MHRDRLALQLELMEKDPELAGVGCRVRLFPRAILTQGLVDYERWLNGIGSPESVRRELFVECPIAHPTLFTRRDVLSEFGYRDRGWPEDYDLILRLALSGKKLAVLPRRLLFWRDSPNRYSRVAEHCKMDRIAECKAWFLCESLLKDHAEYTLWGYGHTGRRLRRLLSTRGKRPAQIIELHPGRIGQRIAGAPVITPEGLLAAPRRPLVVSVAGEGPRGQIRAFLSERGFVESVDFVCAA
jgi:hypothetical protein